MDCPKCREPVSAGLVYCPNCGHEMEAQAAAPVGRHCPSCRKEIAVGTRFCPFCGSAVEAEVKVADPADGRTHGLSFPLGLTIRSLIDALRTKLNLPWIGEDGLPIEYQLRAEGSPDPLDPEMTWMACRGRLPAEPVLQLCPLAVSKAGQPAASGRPSA